MTFKPITTEEQVKALVSLVCDERDLRWVNAFKKQGLIPSCFNLTEGTTPEDVAEAITKGVMRVMGVQPSGETN